MKKLFILFVLAFVAFPAYAQWTFSVKPGIGLNGASIGHRSGNLIPQFSLDYLSVSTDIIEKYYTYDYGSQSIISVNSKDEMSLSIYNLSIGAKYFLSESKKTATYLTGSIMKPIISGEQKNNGTTNKSYSDMVNNMSIWGLSAGFGTEYYFDEHFSIGGEFGVHLMFVSYDETSTDNIYTYSSTYPYSTTVIQKQHDYQFNLNLGITYATMALNYYF